MEKKNEAYKLISDFNRLVEEKKRLEERLLEAVLTVIDEEAAKNPNKPVWENGGAKMFVVKKGSLLAGRWGIEGCVWTESAEVLKELICRSGVIDGVERLRRVLDKAKNGVCEVEFKGGTPSKWWTCYRYIKTVDERYLRNVINRLDNK